MRRAIANLWRKKTHTFNYTHTGQWQTVHSANFYYSSYRLAEQNLLLNDRNVILLKRALFRIVCLICTIWFYTHICINWHQIPSHQQSDSTDGCRPSTACRFSCSNAITRNDQTWCKVKLNWAKETVGKWLVNIEQHWNGSAAKPI